MKTSHFELLGLTPSFDLDLNSLEQSYFSLQRQFHPDRYVGKSVAERMAAAEKSMQINRAYDTLKNPITRAEHLLALQNIIVNTDHDTVKPDHALLTQVMEWQEQLLENPVSAQKVVASEYALTLENLSLAFKNNDFQTAAHLTLQAQYLNKMLHMRNP